MRSETRPWSRMRSVRGGGDWVDPGRRRIRRVLLGAGAVLLVAVATFGLVQSARAASFGRDGKASLIRAEQHLSRRDLDPARKELSSAHKSFQAMGAELDRLGPIRTVARFVPVLRSQIIAVESLQEAAVTVSLAGQRLTDAAQDALRSSEERIPLSGALDRLRSIQAPLAEGTTTLQAAQADVRELEGRRLIGPIGDAFNDFSKRLDRAVDQATSAADGIDAVVEFAGGNGPRRYLFLSQNPDEIRPTGGFIGMYGVFSASAGDLQLENFQPVQVFTNRHPGVEIPGTQAGSPFRLSTPPIPQRITNVNNLPDWPRAARLAVDLWERAGEPPVDGVVSFTPAFLARLLAVLGPVTVPTYGETVTSKNLLERFEFYTEQEETGETGDKKGFVAELGDVIFSRLLEVPSSSLGGLAGAVGDAFAAREMMAWSTNPDVATTLGVRGWDGSFPKTTGDFFYNSEFSYAAKNGRGLRRTFNHEVTLRRDGSASITTTMRIANGEEFGRFNISSLSYIVLYGPEGATLQPASDPPVATDPPVSGHPGAGYLMSAPPGGQATIRIAWEATNIARRGSDGKRHYSLWWMRVPDHSGDVLNLQVNLPEGWRWKGEGPPQRVELAKDVRGSWELAT